MLCTIFLQIYSITFTKMGPSEVGNRTFFLIFKYDYLSISIFSVHYVYFLFHFIIIWHYFCSKCMLVYLFNPSHSNPGQKSFYFYTYLVPFEAPQRSLKIQLSEMDRTGRVNGAHFIKKWRCKYSGIVWCPSFYYFILFK